MFDPFFLPLLLFAPIPLLMFVVYELHRRDRSFAPKGPSLGLAMISIGGLWVLFIVAGFRDGISEKAFGQLVRNSLFPATACIIGGYCLLALLRARRRSKH